MVNTVTLKRSATPAKVPLTTDLALGEVAINTYDGKLYIKKDDGTASVVEVGAAVDISGKQNLLISGTNIKTINSTSLLGAGDIVIDGGAGVYAYDSRATLRGLTPTAGEQAIVDGLGYFVWQAASTEPDDDETAFATASGVWLLVAADPDYVWASGLAEFDLLQGEVDDNTIAIAKLLRGTFVMSLTTLAAQTSSAFTATVTGAATGDIAVATPGNAFGTSAADKGALSSVAYVSAADTVTISIRNASATTADMTASTWSVLVIKQ
jgi:hypothetical protein